MSKRLKCLFQNKDSLLRRAEIKIRFLIEEWMIFSQNQKITIFFENTIILKHLLVYYYYDGKNIYQVKCFSKTFESRHQESETLQKNHNLIEVEKSVSKNTGISQIKLTLIFAILNTWMHEVYFSIMLKFLIYKLYKNQCNFIILKLIKLKIVVMGWFQISKNIKKTFENKMAASYKKEKWPPPTKTKNRTAKNGTLL